VAILRCAECAQTRAIPQLLSEDIVPTVEALAVRYSRAFALLLDSIEQEKWHSVVEVAEIVGWSEDVVRRWIHRCLMEAFVQPATRSRRRRVYRLVRIQG
jgi:hypothetical protein